jgi:hypothetical protein
LSFHIGSRLARDDSIQIVAQSMRAAPLVKGDGKRVGTFELWHRSSREVLILGERTVVTSAGPITKAYVVIMGVAADKSLPELPAGGITLLGCLQHVPSMLAFAMANGIVSKVVRASVTTTAYEARNTTEYNIVVHPYLQGVLDDFYELIKVNPNDMYRINITMVAPSGIILNFVSTPTDPTRVILPGSVTWSKEEVRFFSSDHPLNEFGLFYVALYIAGNYARYYPDRWLEDVDRAAPVALAIEELLAQADQRVPLLALGELSRHYFVDG